MDRHEENNIIAIYARNRALLIRSKCRIIGDKLVVKHNGKWRAYSSTMFRSYIEPEFHFAKKSWVSVQAGYNYHRSATFKKRRPSSFLGHIDDEDNYEFKPSFLLNATLHIGL